LNLRLIEKYRKAGVTFLNPETVELGPDVVIGRNTIIEGNVHLSGKTIIGEGCRIEAGSRFNRLV
jgi:bifunctional UDP-N-acetylglucosamine pyrophosphorylase / glucosamine-1-phosphate N-acetyltransferase